MADAKYRRTGQFSSGIFEGGRADLVKQRTTNTYKSQVFAGEEPTHKSASKRKIVSKDNGVLEGAKLQAAALKLKCLEGPEPSSLPAAGRPLSQKPIKNRITKTSISSVFAAAKQASRRYNVHRPSDTRDIIGNEDADFYRKAVSEFIPVVEFSPAYKETSPFKRRQQELHNGYVGTALTRAKSSERFTESLSAKQRTALNLTSSVLNSPEKHACLANQSRNADLKQLDKLDEAAWRGASAKEKRKNDHHSNIFGLDSPVFRSPPRQEVLSTLEQMLVSRPERAKSEIRCRRTRSTDTESEGLTAKDRKLRHLRSSLDLTASAGPIAADDGIVSRSFAVDPEACAKDLKQRELQSDLHSLDFYTKTTDTEVQDLLVVGVYGHRLKEVCKGVQVLNLEEDIDPVTGKFKGSARLKIKGGSEKVKDIVMTLTEEGANTAAYKPNLGKSK
jgi:hypothetical protein